LIPPSLRHYERGWLVADVIAGLTSHDLIEAALEAAGSSTDTAAV